MRSNLMCSSFIRPLELTGVEDKLVLPDPTRPIELHALRGEDHSGSMLMAYLPAERILIQADLNRAPGPKRGTPVPPFTARADEETSGAWARGRTGRGVSSAVRSLPALSS